MERYYKVSGTKVDALCDFASRHPNVINPGRLSEKEYNKKGYYRYVAPVYNPATHSVGKLCFDKKNKLVTRQLIAVVYDINELKARKVQEIKAQRNEFLSWSDKLALRKIKYGDDIPEEVLQAGMAVREKSRKMISEVQALDSIEKLLGFSTGLNIEQYYTDY